MPRLTVDLAPQPAWTALEPPKGMDLPSCMGRIQAPLSLPYAPETLTIAMIVKNEAKNIADAVKSFRAIADEIVVNDTGSTDGTQGILEQLGVKWFQGDWRGDFSYARNLALDQATSSWVLWMDADDRIPEDQIENFRKLKTAPLDRAFGFQVINTQGGLPIGGRFMQVRMFPNDKRLRFRYRIHEQVLHAIAALGLHLFYTETTLWHTGYEDPALKHAKARRNLDLLAQETERMADEPALAMSVGDSHYILGEWQKGIEAYSRVFAMPGCEKRHRDVYAEMPACIGRGHQHLGHYNEAISWFEKGMALQPEKVEPVFYRGECLMALGRKSEAEVAFEKVTHMPLTFTATANQYDVVRMYAFYHLASLQGERGDDAAAEATLKRMHSSYTQVVESWILLGQILARQGRHAEALQAFEKSLSINDKARSEAHLGRLQALATMHRESEYAGALAQAETAFPQARFPTLQQAQGKASLTPRKARLSLCMIVKNEEKNLPGCLASVRGLADEVIVVDTGSQDGTREVAKQFGARLVEAAWRDDFSWARNISLEHATGDWILWLDADDRVEAAQAEAIRRLIDDEPLPANRAFGFLIKNSGDNGLTGSVFRQIRLFPNRPDLRFESPIHEQVLPSLERAGIAVEFKPIQILHTGYADESTARRKQLRNRAMLEKQIENPTTQGQATPITYYTLGNACLDLGDHAAAETWYRRAAELATERGDNPHVRKHAPIKIAVTLASRGRHEEAWKVLQPVLQSVVPLASQSDLAAAGAIPAEALLVKAQLLASLGREPEALEAYESLLDLKEDEGFMPVDVGLIKVKALQYLACYHHARGERETAMRLLRLGLGIAKGQDVNAAMVRGQKALAA